MPHGWFPNWAYLARLLKPTGHDLDDPRFAGEGDWTSMVLRRKPRAFAMWTGLASGLAVLLVPIFLFFAFNVPRSGRAAFRLFWPWVKSVWPSVGLYVVGIVLGGAVLGLLRCLTFRVGRVRVRAFAVGVLFIFVSINVAAVFVYEHSLIHVVLVPVLIMVLLAWLVAHDLTVLMLMGPKLKDVLAREERVS